MIKKFSKHFRERELSREIKRAFPLLTSRSFDAGPEFTIVESCQADTSLDEDTVRIVREASARWGDTSMGIFYLTDSRWPRLKTVALIPVSDFDSEFISHLETVLGEFNGITNAGFRDLFIAGNSKQWVFAFDALLDFGTHILVERSLGIAGVEH